LVGIKEWTNAICPRVHSHWEHYLFGSEIAWHWESLPPQYPGILLGIHFLVNLFSTIS